MRRPRVAPRASDSFDETGYCSDLESA